MYESKSRTKRSIMFVANGDILFDDSSNNIVRLPNNKFAVLNGLDGYIVAEEGNVLLVARKKTRLH